MLHRSDAIAEEESELQASRRALKLINTSNLSLPMSPSPLPAGAISDMLCAIGEQPVAWMNQAIGGAASNAASTSRSATGSLSSAHVVVGGAPELSLGSGLNLHALNSGTNKGGSGAAAMSMSDGMRVGSAKSYGSNNSQGTKSGALPSHRAPSAPGADMPSINTNSAALGAAGLSHMDMRCWHEIEAHCVTDPACGEKLLVLVQSDVSHWVNSDLHVKKVGGNWQTLFTFSWCHLQNTHRTSFAPNNMPELPKEQSCVHQHMHPPQPQILKCWTLSASNIHAYHTAIFLTASE